MIKVNDQDILLARRLTQYASVVLSISSEEIMSHTRKKKALLARAMIVMQLRQKGYSLMKIAQLVDRHHSTVINIIKSYVGFQLEHESKEKIREYNIILQENEKVSEQ